MVDKADFALVVPWDGQRVWLVEQERAGARSPAAGPRGAGPRVGAFTVAELEAMLLDGRVADAASVAAWGLVGLRGLRPED